MENESVGADPMLLSVEITSAWLANPNTRASAADVPAFLKTVFEAVSDLATETAAPETATPEQQDYIGAVTVRKSLASADHIISMIDGKPYRTLRRHLSTNGLTPDEYRTRYNLKADYPMVAPSYSEARRAMAHKIGLGSKGRAARAAAPAKSDKPRRKTRERQTEAE